VFSTLLFHQLIPPREILRSNLAPDRQYQTTTTTTFLKLRRKHPVLELYTSTYNPTLYP